MTTTVVIASNKGGTGKTTTTVTLGHGLARMGYKVLLVDCDPQGNLADFVGKDPAPGLYRLLKEQDPLPGVVIPAVRENLDIVPGSHETAAAAKEIISERGLDYRLEDALAGSGYDWILIDTAPSISLIQELALIAADLLVIPTELTYASALGVGQVLRMAAGLHRKVRGMHLEFAGVLPTKWDRRLNESEDQLKALTAKFPDKVWLPIPTDSKVSEAPAWGKTLWEHAPDCSALLGRKIDRYPEPFGGYARALERLLREAGE